MEEGTRSGDSNGVVVKNRNSSGCLIIRKKSDGKGSGVVGSSGSRPVFDSKKEKKRPRLVGSDSGSSDERLEQYRRRVGNGYDKRIVEKSDEGGRKRSSMELINYRNDVDGTERKMTSRLGVFEFDEYDAIDDSDDEVVGKGFPGSKAMGGSGIRREFETGTSNGDIVYKRKHSYFDRASDYVNNRFEVKRGGARVPVSLLRDKFGDTSEEPIRVQGRNGVLKVMPNKKKKGSGLLKTYDHLEVSLRSKDTVKRNELARPSFYSEQKVHSKAGSSAMAEKSKLNLQKSSATKNSKALDWESDNSDTSLKLGKNKLVLQKSSVIKKSKALDWESDNSDTSLKLGPKKLEGDKPVKLVRNKGEITPPPSEKIPATGSNEGKIKRGSGTEKQKLREQIRKMLLDAGWTIDYRPRRNRDYQDAVYVNPSGTAYWSIVKAYDALQKQFDEEDDSLKPTGDCSSFSPISENVLSKLTRQTRKKIEKEMKRKQRDANVAKNAQESAGKKSSKYKHDTASKGSDRAEEKLSSFLKQGSKSLKGRTIENAVNDSNAESQNEANYTSEDNLNGNLSIHGRKSRKLGRCTLVVRSTKNGQNSETDGYIPYTGKRTLLSWLIDSETVGSSEKVQYMNRRQTRVMQEGWITRDGIHCGCCSKILSVTKFEIHAGSKLRQPFQNIYLESGISLLQCQMDAWNKQEESERSSYHSVYVDGDDPNDDTCGICGDGGDLICCDGCPSTFHQTCLGIQMLPTGDWHCPNCTCKLCGMAGSSIAQGNEKSGCALPTCSLCERKYHQSCVLDVDALPVDSTCPSFCGQKCREMFENLQKFLGVKHELEGGFSWSLIHRTDISDSDTSVRGLTQRVECNSKLAVALTVMDECFLPILDRRSGINLIHNVLYNCGSNFNRLNYSGFYTAILERGDEIISAASIRFHGTQLAEMPFIGTRHIYRRQGMCSRLFRAIESALCSFKVEKLIIPAISELMHTWTEVFGFDYLEESQKEELRSMNILVFPGIDMLRKLLLEDENNHENVTSSTGAKSMQLEGEPSFMADSLNKSGEDSLVGHDLHACEGASVSHVVGTDDKVADASDSASQGSGVILNDVSVPSTSLDAPHEVKVTLSSDEIICANSQSGEKVPESATETKSMFPASQGSGVTLNDISVPSTSLDAPHEVKVPLSSDEIVCTNSQSGEKVPESATESKSMFPASQGSGVTLNDVSVPSTSLDAPDEVQVSLSSDEIMCANSQSGDKVPESATGSKSMFPASQGSGVTLNDVSVPSTSLDAPHEVKVSLSSDEIMCANSQSGEKVSESATELKSMFPASQGSGVTLNDVSVPSTSLDTSHEVKAFLSSDEIMCPNSQSGEKVPESATESKSIFPASQGSGVTLNDVSVPSTSLDASHAVKVSLSSDEIMCPNSQSGEKVPESATESKSIFPVDASNVVLEREDNSILDSQVDGDSKFSYDMDVLNGRNNAASVEPVSHYFEKVSAQNTTGETDENKDDVSVSSLHGNDENTMRCNSDLDSHNPCEKEGRSCDVSKDASDVPRCNENVVDSSGECAETGVHEMRTGSQLGHNLSESASDSGTNVPELKIRSPSGDDLAANVSGSKCISSCNNNQDACKMKNTPTFDTPLGGDIQSSSEADIDGASVNDSVAGVEPVLILSGGISTHNSTEEINEDKKATSFSTSHGIDESMTEF